MMEPDLILENRNGELAFKSDKLLSAIDEQIIKTVIRFQHDYFLTGDEALMKPMILRDIAAITKFDISTVSRAVNNMNVQTHFGVFSLKSLFSEGVQTKNNGKVSAFAVRKIMQAYLDDDESLCDSHLTKILQQEGYLIARRTVSKYRHLLNIPVARLRRREAHPKKLIS
ncbi:MAG: hypothetical protein LBV39_02980 [Bacteroidales bacterium]|nr:hypothetical protein [Bacteroidales bacterium]